MTPLTTLAPPATAPSFSMVLDAQGQPVVAWTEGSAPTKVQVRRWTGSAWESLGEVSRASADVLLGRGGLALDGDGQPLLATVVRTASRSDVQLWRPNR